MPSRHLYVLGHKNPDTDAVCAAVGYAALEQLRGRHNVLAGRQGPLRPETAYLLDRFQVPPPDLVSDIRPRVADAMTSPAFVVQENASLFDVGGILESEGIRVVAVVDAQGRLRGVTGQADFAQAFVARLETFDRIPLERANLLRALGGTVLVDAPHRELGNRVMVGAMQVESMLRRLAPGDLLVLGDRTDAQLAAIQFGVGGLIVTGDDPVSPEVIQLARERDVLLVAVEHHTFTTLRLIQLSIPVRHVMQSNVATCGPDDLVEEVRERLRGEPIRSLIVVDDDDTVVGIISRSNLLRVQRPEVVLVDHNERGQAVVGIEDADVVAVVDHHRVADFWTRTPPFMRLEPVGATSTIVAKLFAESGLDVPPAIAGILLGAILTDTLAFRSPTSTDEDRRVAGELAPVAGVDIEELGTAILDRASDVSDRTSHELIASDYKEFNVDGCKFGIGVIETTNGASVLARQAELFTAMSSFRERGYHSVLFAVVDIIRGRTSILIDGYPEAVASALHATIVGGDRIEIPAIVSRKKNIVPALGEVARLIPR